MKDLFDKISNKWMERIHTSLEKFDTELNWDLNDQIHDGVVEAVENDDDYPDDVPENSIKSEIDRYQKFKTVC